MTDTALNLIDIQNCVTHTALSPQSAGFKVDLLTDLCTSVSEPIHRIALNGLNSRLTQIESARILN